MDLNWQRERRDSYHKLEAHLRRNYHAPDIEGVKIVTAAATAHFLWPPRAPVWLFVMGASGTGKTSLVGSLLSGFPNYNVLSNLTPHTLLSGLTIGKKKELGLLQRLGPQILFWISDLSSVTSMREDNRAEVMAQLREIYDGEIHKDYGTGKREDWVGKATVIAGCTPSIERIWSLGKELGERFLILRWRHGSLEELAVAATQIRNEREMRAETAHLVREWVGDLAALRRTAPLMTEAQVRDWHLDRLATMVSKLRVGIVRDRGEKSASHITDIGHAEGPGRIINTLTLVASSHAALMGRSELADEDLALARRIARETIPGPRATVISSIAGTDRPQLNTHDVWRGCAERGWQVSINTIRFHLEDLSALGIVDATEHSGTKWWKFTPWFEERREIIGWQKPNSTRSGGQEDPSTASGPSREREPVAGEDHY